MSRIQIAASPETEERSVRARVAVLVPCYNEEMTVGQVVTDFRAVLPEADIYVFDNNSSDRTAEEARQLGARGCRCRTSSEPPGGQTLRHG